MKRCVFLAQIAHIFPRNTANDSIANRPQLHRRQQIQIVNTPTFDRLVRKRRMRGQTRHPNHHGQMKRRLHIPGIKKGNKHSFQSAKRIPRATTTPLSDQLNNEIERPQSLHPLPHFSQLAQHFSKGHFENWELQHPQHLGTLLVHCFLIREVKQVCAINFPRSLPDTTISSKPLKIEIL